jgi:hypothetical protein
MRHLLFGAFVLLACACGGDDGEPECNPAGRWTLSTTFRTGDCAQLGSSVADEIVISDGGDVFLAALVVPGGSVPCDGQVSSSCAAELVCVAELEREDGATSDATVTYSLRFDGERVSGTAALVVDGDAASCSGSGDVGGAR